MTRSLPSTDRQATKCWRPGTPTPEQRIIASTAFFPGSGLSGPQWDIVAAADFDRYEIVENDEFAIRHTPDILRRNSTTGDNRLVLMDYWRGTYGWRRDKNLVNMPTRFVAGAVVPRASTNHSE